MNLNLYPYNFWVLYAAIALAVIFLIVLLVKLMKLAKTAAALEPQLSHMNDELKLMEIKSEVVKEKTTADWNRIRPLLVAIPVLYAIYAIYKNDDSLKGIKGYEKAARRYMDRQRDEKRIAKAVAKVLVK